LTADRLAKLVTIQGRSGFGLAQTAATCGRYISSTISSHFC
jgi:hypothetical protein